MRIGITINVGGSSIWSNGVNQNAIYLAMVFAKGGHDSNIIYSSQEKNKTEDELKKLPLDVNCIKIQDSFSQKFDVIVQLGLTCEKAWMDAWKSNNKYLKYVSYECGNHFFIDNEKILHNQHNGDKPPKRTIEIPNPDQIWVIPQMENTNLFYYQHKRECNKATVVPFVWDPVAIESYANENNLKTYTERPIERVGVMEPNMSIMKNCIFPMVVLERYLKWEKGDLKKIHLIGGEKLKENYTFKKFVHGTEMYNKGLLTAEPRMQTHSVLSKWVDVVLSWQLENPLNYLYFDVCWLGWPLVHNAELCQDIGYYYPEQDAERAIRSLKNAINKHNRNKSYMDKSRKIIKRYTRENKELVDNYNKLLDDLVNDKFKRRKYVWKSNSII